MELARLEQRYQQNIRNGFLTAALGTVEQILSQQISSELRFQYNRALQRLQQRIFDSSTYERPFPVKGVGLGRKGGDFPMADHMASRYRAKGHPAEEGKKRVADDTGNIIKIVSADPGVTCCPSRTVGRLKPYAGVQEMLRDKCHMTISRFQSLKLGGVSGANGGTQTLRLTYLRDNVLNETAMPFYIFRITTMPHVSDYVPANGAVPEKQLKLRPKVCYRLYCRDAYNYNENTSAVPQFYFKPYETGIERNAPDIVTEAARNDYKIEYTTDQLSVFPRVKRFRLGWSEFQILLKHGNLAENAVAKTGHIQFPACCEPNIESYISDYTGIESVNNTPMTMDECIAWDSYWTRYFNKNTAHPLARGGMMSNKLAPLMRYQKQHRLDQSGMSAMTMCLRVNHNRTVSTRDTSDVANALPAQVINGFYSAKYLQQESTKGFGAFPEFGKSSFAFISGSDWIDSPSTSELSTMTFDVMLRTQVQYGSSLIQFGA